MENRVGICSLLRERISHVLRANVESRVTVMTHDAATVAELEHVLGDVKRDFEPSDNYGYCLLELTEGATLQYTRTRKNQYSIWGCGGNPGPGRGHGSGEGMIFWTPS